MRVVAGVIGALIGATVGVLLVEVAFANDQSWPDAVPVGLAVLGWLTGKTLVQHRRERRGATIHGH
jgi:hypothetical protein